VSFFLKHAVYSSIYDDSQSKAYRVPLSSGFPRTDFHHI